MKPGHIIPKPIVMLLAVGLFLTLTASMLAQVQSTTTTTEGAGKKHVEVRRGEVVYVSGNHVIVKMENGAVRDLTVPDSATATVDGKEIGVHELKVGMKLEKTITTTTTPKMITKVETVTGKVFHVSPPNTVILTMENNENQQFKIPKGQKFSIDGQMVDAFGLKKGMIVSATKVTETPETQVTTKAMVAGTLPPPPPPAPEAPILIVSAPPPAPAAAPAPAETAEAAPQALPKTGSYLPAIGLAGVLMLCMGLGLRAVRGSV